MFVSFCVFYNYMVRVTCSLQHRQSNQNHLHILDDLIH